MTFHDFLPHVLYGGFENNGLAATLTLHTWHDGSKAVESLADGLAPLLLGANVILFLLGFGQARTVCAGWGRLGAWHGAGGRLVQEGLDKVDGGQPIGGLWDVDVNGDYANVVEHEACDGKPGW